MDSDDEITEDCILKMTNQVIIYPQVEIVQGVMQSIPDRPYYHLDRYQDVGYKEDNLWIRHEYYKRKEHFPCNITNKLIKIEFIKANKLYLLENVIYEDEHWMFRAAQCLNKFIVISDKTYIRYIRSGSIMQSLAVNPQKSSDSCYLIIMDLIPQMDQILRNEQIKKLIWLLLNKYKHQGDKAHLHELKNRLCKEFISEHMYIDCCLLWLIIFFSNIKGGWRIKKKLVDYLEKID